MSIARRFLYVKQVSADANTGFEFFEKVVRWTNQDLNKKL